MSTRATAIVGDASEDVPIPAKNWYACTQKAPTCIASTTTTTWTVYSLLRTVTMETPTSQTSAGLKSGSLHRYAVRQDGRSLSCRRVSSLAHHPLQPKTEARIPPRLGSPPPKHNLSKMRFFYFRRSKFLKSSKVVVRYLKNSSIFFEIGNAVSPESSSRLAAMAGSLVTLYSSFHQNKAS